MLSLNPSTAADS